MKEDETAVISLPDRLSHVLDVKYGASPASAPSLLGVNLSHHMRQGSIGSYAGNDVDSRSGSSLHTIEPDNEDSGHQRSFDQIDDVEHTDNMDVAISDSSLVMPGCDTVEDLEQSAHELLSRMPKGTTESQMLPKMTMTPRTKLSEIRQGLSARKVANLKERHHAIFRELERQETPSMESTEEEDADANSFDTCLHDTAGACPVICLRKRMAIPEKLVADAISHDDGQGVELTIAEHIQFVSKIALESGDGQGVEQTLAEHVLFVSKIALETEAPTSPLTLETFAESSHLLPWSEQEMSPPSPPHEKNASSIFDCVLDCFDRPVHDHYLSPQTVSSLCTHFDEIPNVFDDVLPCWHDDLEDFREFKDYLSLKNSIIGEESKSKEGGSVDPLLDDVLESLLLDPETDSSNDNICSGTITFSIPIDKLVRLQSRRHESVSIFLDTLAFMCPDRVGRVRQIQSLLTNAAARNNKSINNQALRSMEEIHEEKWEGVDESIASKSDWLGIIPEGAGVVPERSFLFDIDHDDEEELLNKDTKNEQNRAFESEMDIVLEEAKEDLAKLKFGDNDGELDPMLEEGEEDLDLREYGTHDDDPVADFKLMLKEADDELTSLLSS